MPATLYVTCPAGGLRGFSGDGPQNLAASNVGIREYWIRGLPTKKKKNGFSRQLNARRIILPNVYPSPAHIQVVAR
jgi:hypothetical protein